MSTVSNPVAVATMSYWRAMQAARIARTDMARRGLTDTLISIAGSEVPDSLRVAAGRGAVTIDAARAGESCCG